MRYQPEIITLDSFHLQLTQLQKQEEQLSQRIIKQDNPFYHKLKTFQISISRVSSILYFGILSIFICQTLDVYLTAFSKVYSNIGPIIFQISIAIQSYKFVGYFISPFLITLILITLVFNNQNQQSGFLQLFNKISLKMYPYMRYIVQINLIVSSYFALDAEAGPIALLVIAALLGMFTSIFIQNFTLRKDQFCCKSVQFSLILRICILCSFSINIFGFSQVSNQSNFILFAILHLINSTFLILNYYYQGITIYRHTFPRYMTFLIIISYNVLSISMLYDITLIIISGAIQTIIYAIIAVSLSIMIFFNLSTLQKIKRVSNGPQNLNLKEKIYFLFNKFEYAHEQEEVDCQLRGILFHHKAEKCINPQCYVNQKQLYDPKKKKNCSIFKIGQSKVSLIKFYTKCLFQNAIQKDKQSTSILLDFIQFYYLKLKNVFQVTKLIAHIEERYLSFLQKIRLHRLKVILKQQCNGFSQELYLKALSIQNILESEQQFSQIQRKIEVVLLRNELFWKYIERDEVNLNDISNTIKPNFKLICKINEQWTRIAHYFNINRAWKFYYLCFTVYLKNEKVSPTMLEDFGNSVEYDTIFKTGNHFIDKTTEKQQLYNSIMLFQKNTCFVHTLCDDEKMIITKVSKYFAHHFDYNSQDIVHFPIHVLMPPTVKKIHHSAFIRWLRDGRCYNEEYYSVKKVYPVTKKGFIIPSFKFYKYYLKLNGEAEYIAMFKRNRQDEQIILVNEDFQIQAVTQVLFHKFKLVGGDYSYLRGLNILSLMPMIIKYTRFGSLLTEHDQDFVSNDDNQNYIRKQSTHMKDNNITQQNAEMFDMIHLKKTLNLTNVKMFLPCDLQATLLHYNTLIEVSKLDTYRAVKDLYSYIRKTKLFSKFKVQISIHERVMMKQVFYEIQINELEENNKLQKLLEAKSQQAISADSMTDIIDNRLSSIDLQLFFHSSKKKSRVVLFPSNNIFIKDESNKALKQISHIKNIKISIRVSLILFIIITISQLIVDLVISKQIKLLSSQYFWVSQHQKIIYILNNQYNLQHLQRSNGMVQSFYILQYTHSLQSIMEQPDFKQLLFDSYKNVRQFSRPYYLGQIHPSKIMLNTSCPLLDQLQIFLKMYQTSITLHRIAQVYEKDRLQNREYYEFNNYIDAYYNKTTDIKNLMVIQFENAFSTLQQMMTVLAITQSILIIVCFIFIFTRLLNVSRGFTELVGIFVQMDNLDIRKIFRFTQFVIGLFGRLNDKSQKSSTSSQFTSQSITKDQKYSEMSFTDQQCQLSLTANLNKKIKKLNLGNQISKMRCSSLILIIFFLLLVVSGLLSYNIYAILSLSNYKIVQEQGFMMMDNSAIINILITGMIQKFRKAQIYSPIKYLNFLNIFANEESNSSDLSIASGNLQFQKLYKIIYYQNFCQQIPQITQKAIAQSLSLACVGGVNMINPARCSYLSGLWSASFRINRCINIQNSQLKKGVNNFYNYLYYNIFQYFNNKGNFTVNDITQINTAQIIIDMFDKQLMETWKNQAYQMLVSRENNTIVIVLCIVVFLLVLHIIFVEYLISGNIIENYEVFRKMHEHLIPEFVINKQKIIKARLIKEGFMKE